MAGSIGQPSRVRVPDADFTRSVILSGNVIMGDGEPLPGPVAIERVCGTSAVRMGYTDAKGFFSFPLGQTIPAMQDASENRDSLYQTGLGTAVGGSLGVSQANGFPALAGCELRALLPGFQSSSVKILVTPSLEPTHVGTIALLRGDRQGRIISATSMTAPKGARKAYEKATAYIKKQELANAQAELERAVKAYPNYAVAWSDLGWVREQQNRLDEARDAFTRARAADDNFVPAYLGLASVAIRQSRWTEAQEFSQRATHMDGADFPVGFYYNAFASFQLGQLEDAEKNARLAERLDTRHSLPQVKSLLGDIMAAKASPVPSPAGNLPTPAAVATPANLQVEPLKNWEEIDRVSATIAPVSAKNWAPPDIDQAVPPVDPGVPCPVQDVLSGVSSRAKELMANLQQFSATEQIEHTRVDKAGKPDRPASASFKYVAEIRETAPGELTVNEYRDGAANKASLGKVAATGMTAHALMFHPSLIGDLAITCEGLGSLQGRPVWQLRFAQRQDRPVPFRYYSTPRGQFLVQMKGRAWVTSDTYQVMRMETDLAKPIDEIKLQKDHLIIDYQPVEFPKRKLQLWLPQTADLYMDFAGQRSHRRHTLSDFELFWVDVAQKTLDPEVR